jgi:hypothetical protein
MRLIVGPENQREDLVEPAKEIWEHVVREIGELPWRVCLYA